MTAVRTLGQFVTDERIVEWLGEEMTRNHRDSDRGASEVATRARLTMSCPSCPVTKACCSSYVIVRLYEGLVIADELRRTSRDTPELRAELRERADAMEAMLAHAYARPCVFLDSAERCTVYAVRPTTCAQLHVYSDPALCVARSPQVRSYTPREEVLHANRVEETFRDRMALRRKVGRRYLGVLPRMVLVSLEAWDRTDFRDHLRQLPWPTDEDWARIIAPA